MNKFYKAIVLLLIVIITISSIYIFKEILKQNTENNVYKNFQDDITENIIEDLKDNTEENNLSNFVEKENKKEINQMVSLENLHKKNSDLVGWIKIDGTNINYPVMQSNLENGNYYLHRNFYKKYSTLGTPFIQSNCDINNSSNLIIYGHHIKSGLVFADLVKYKNYNFYKNHRYIKFYTLSEDKKETIENTYEIVIAFKTVVYSDKGFKYYNYTNFSDVRELNDFIGNCRKLEFYNTGIDINYGDKLITLSTCEYSQKNGRIVVVSKKI